MQRFEGRSVEEALAAAASQLGTGLKVREARRVRRGGVLGFFSREHFEVTAEPNIDLTQPAPMPPSGSRAGEDHLDHVLRSLVAEVEARETIPTLTSRPAEERRAPVRFTDDDLTPLAAVEAPAPVPMAEAAPAPAARPLRASAQPTAEAVIDVTEHAPANEEAAAPSATAAFYDFEVLDAQAIERIPKWTRKALRDLGMPAMVLKAIPERTPSSDMAWTKALERAIAKMVPEPAALDEEHDTQVSGLGGSGAINIIRAGCNGFTPGLLHIDGRSVPATATELALAVRSCLPR